MSGSRITQDFVSSAGPLLALWSCLVVHAGEFLTPREFAVATLSEQVEPVPPIASACLVIQTGLGAGAQWMIQPVDGGSATVIAGAKLDPPRVTAALRRVLWTDNESPDQPVIHLLDIGAGKKRRLGLSGKHVSPLIGLNIHTVLDIDRTGARVANVDSQQRIIIQDLSKRTVTIFEPPLPPVHWLRWSPNGDTLAVVADTRAIEGKRIQTLYLLSLDGALRAVHQGPALGPVHWHPKGDSLAFGPTSGTGLMSENWDGPWLLVPCGGGKAETLLNKASSLSWSPDGSALAYRVTSGPKEMIVLARWTGNQIEEPRSQSGPDPRFSPKLLGWLNAGSIAFAGRTKTGEVAYRTVMNGEPPVPIPMAADARILAVVPAAAQPIASPSP